VRNKEDKTIVTYGIGMTIALGPNRYPQKIHIMGTKKFHFYEFGHRSR